MCRTDIVEFCVDDDSEASALCSHGHSRHSRATRHRGHNDLTLAFSVCGPDHVPWRRPLGPPPLRRRSLRAAARLARKSAQPRPSRATACTCLRPTRHPRRASVSFAAATIPPGPARSAPAAAKPPQPRITPPVPPSSPLPLAASIRSADGPGQRCHGEEWSGAGCRRARTDEMAVAR